MASSTAVMVADTVKKDVVYSAECFDESCKPLDASTKLLVEYSVVALEARLMAPGDQHDTIKYIDASIKIISGCLAIGAFAFPPAAPVLAAIAAVGAGISFLMKLIPDNRPDPVVEKYKELQALIHQLEDKMTAHFADMQAFISEHTFDVNIATQSATLMQFMRNCIQYQNEGDVKNFAREYEKNAPVDLAYTLGNFLDFESTNPLLMAMKTEKVKTKATFNKWKTIITGILGELLFIETFASGLLNKTKHNQESIVEQWDELTASLEKWENDYKNDQQYWTELKNDFDKYFIDHTHLNNIQKAEELKKRLDNCLTHDAFYICVFNSTRKETDYTYYCESEKEQLIIASDKGRCNAFVYRSRKGAKYGQAVYEKLKGQVRECEDQLNWKGSLNNIIKDQLLNKSLVPGYGFYCLMGSMHCDPQIYYLNSPEPDWFYKGPGHSTKLLMNRDGGKQEYHFIVSFK